MKRNKKSLQEVKKLKANGARINGRQVLKVNCENCQELYVYFYLNIIYSQLAYAVFNLFIC